MTNSTRTLAIPLLAAALTTAGCGITNPYQTSSRPARTTATPATTTSPFTSEDPSDRPPGSHAPATKIPPAAAAAAEQTRRWRRRCHPPGRAPALRPAVHQLDLKHPRRSPARARLDLARPSARPSAPGRRELHPRHRPSAQHGRQRRHRRLDRPGPGPCRRQVGDRHQRDDHRPGRLQRPTPDRARHLRAAHTHPQRLDCHRMGSPDVISPRSLLAATGLVIAPDRARRAALYDRARARRAHRPHPTLTGSLGDAIGILQNNLRVLAAPFLLWLLKFPSQPPWPPHRRPPDPRADRRQRDPRRPRAWPLAHRAAAVRAAAATRMGGARGRDPRLARPPATITRTGAPARRPRRRHSCCCLPAPRASRHGAPRTGSRARQQAKPRTTQSVNPTRLWVPVVACATDFAPATAGSLQGRQLPSPHSARFRSAV